MDANVEVPLIGAGLPGGVRRRVLEQLREVDLPGRAEHLLSMLSAGSRRLGSPARKPERCWQREGKNEVAMQLELARDQEPLGAGSPAYKTQKRQWFKLECQRRPASATPRCPTAAVDERELVAVAAAVSPAGDPELHDRVEACLGLCALTDSAKDLPQQDAAKPAAHDRLESLVRGRAHPPCKRLGLEVGNPAPVGSVLGLHHNVSLLASESGHGLGAGTLGTRMHPGGWVAGASGFVARVPHR